jgi:hypothetical protein
MRLDRVGVDVWRAALVVAIAVELVRALAVTSRILGPGDRGDKQHHHCRQQHAAADEHAYPSTGNDVAHYSRWLLRPSSPEHTPDRREGREIMGQPYGTHSSRISGVCRTKIRSPRPAPKRLEGAIELPVKRQSHESYGQHWSSLTEIAGREARPSGLRLHESRVDANSTLLRLNAGRCGRCDLATAIQTTKSQISEHPGRERSLEKEPG